MQRPSPKPVQQASPLPLQLQPPPQGAAPLPQAAAQRLPAAAAAPPPVQQPALATRQSAMSQPRLAEPGSAPALAQPQGLVRSPLQQYPSPIATHEQVPRRPTQRGSFSSQRRWHGAGLACHAG